MTLVQIYAVIALLVAFNVPQAQINQVQGILLASTVPTTMEVGGPAGTPVIEVIKTPTVRTRTDWCGGDCSPFK